MQDRIAQIKIDYNLCQDPLNCRACLTICPSVVFVCGPTKVWKFRETGPEEYKVAARYFDKCSGCGDCEKACPTGALELSFVSRADLRERYRAERAAKLAAQAKAT